MFTFGTPNLGTRRLEEFFIQVKAGLAVSTSDNHGKPSLVCALFLLLARVKVTAIADLSFCRLELLFVTRLLEQGAPSPCPFRQWF